jgi:uncharacterized repeat protein (TIGR02543 family)
VSENNPAYTSANGILFNKNLTALIQCPGGLSGAYTIPDSVTSIGNWAFYDCTKLASVTIPDSVTNIGNYAFSSCSSLTSVDIPDSVTSIGNSAFGNCYRLTAVNIPDSVTAIGYLAFYNCTKITSVTIPDSVTSIGDSAFSSCNSLTSVNIGNSVTNIGNWAFCGCESLTAINVSENNLAYASVNGILFDKNLTALIQCPGGFAGAYTIPDSVTNIGDGAFYGCKSLTSGNIPDSVTNIGGSAFYDCSSLTGAYFKGNAPSKGNNVFAKSTQTTVYRLLYATGWPTVPEPWGGRPTAYWPVTVMLDPLGGAVDPSSVTVSNGFAYGILPIPIRDGYTFDGWHTTADDAGTQVTPSTVVTTLSDQTLYAKWITADPYEVENGQNTVPVGKVTAVVGTIENSGGGGASIQLGGVGLLDDGDMAGLEWSVTGRGVLSFDWKVSSEADWDVLRFYEVGTGETNVISGTGSEWTRVTRIVEGDSPHTFRWEYEKDPHGDYVGDDCGWIDAINWAPSFGLTVNGGTGGGTYTNGTVVAVSADAPPAHYLFDVWTGDTGAVADVHAATTTLTMPATNATITATYKPILYPVEVVGGQGSGSYAYGSTVTLSADIPEGKRFYRWAGDTANIADLNAPTTTVYFAGESLAVTSTYCVPLIVTQGTGSGWYPEGATAVVKADPDPMWMEFAGWIGDGTGQVENVFLADTTLVIPTRPSALTATYTDSVARVAGCYGRAFTRSGVEGGISTDFAAGSPSGTPAVRLGGAGVVPDNGFAAFETSVFGSGTVTFWWRVSSERDADYLKFLVDGTQVAAISGTKGPWAQVSQRIEGAGVSHVLRWEYAKNDSFASSIDAGWVDDIVWTGDIPEPVLSPDIQETAFTNGVFGIRFLGERGISYAVYSNATLNADGWAFMQTVTQEEGETNGVFRFGTVILPPVGQRSGFYRIKSGP